MKGAYIIDNSLSESARFAVYREKLKGICEANNLSYVFIKNAYPIKLVIRPLGGVGEQMSMLEEATEDNYISPGASILFTVKDGNLTYRMSKTFTISDTLFNKIKNIFKNMHYLWLQFFFRDLVEGGKLAALGYKMPDIPESGGQQETSKENEPNLPEQAEPLEEIEDDEEDEPTSDELTQAAEIARQNNGITQAMLEEKMGVTAEKAIALLDDMESAGVIEFSNGHYLLADTEEE